MEERNPLLDAWIHINSENWDDPKFTLGKAYVCCLLSECAYWHVPDFELEDSKRIKIIPCDAYESYVRQGKSFQLTTLLQEADFGESYVIVRRYAVVVMVKTRVAVFVAIRGTKYLYDWLVNLYAIKYKLDNERGIRFHRGFFRAMSSCLLPISQKLRDYISSDTPIYVTGHSLGGAMSAVMHALWGMTLNEGESVHEGVVRQRISTHSSYTFGMPRYGNLNAVANLKTPYHIYNEKDIVPTVPPKWLGFESCFDEYRLDGVEIEQFSNRESINFLNWIGRLATTNGIKEHSIELYRSRLFDLLNDKN